MTVLFLNMGEGMGEGCEEVGKCLRRAVTEVVGGSADVTQHSISVTAMNEDAVGILGEIEVLGAGICKFYELFCYLLHVFVYLVTGKRNLLFFKSEQQHEERGLQLGHML